MYHSNTLFVLEEQREDNWHMIRTYKHFKSAIKKMDEWKSKGTYRIVEFKSMGAVAL